MNSSEQINWIRSTLATLVDVVDNEHDPAHVDAVALVNDMSASLGVFMGAHFGPAAPEEE